MIKSHSFSYWWPGQQGAWGCVTRVVSLITHVVQFLQLSLAWARVNSSEFAHPRVDPPITTFASLYQCSWSERVRLVSTFMSLGDSVPYQRSAPPKRHIRAIILAQPPCRVSHIPRLSTWNETSSNQQAWLS